MIEPVGRSLEKRQLATNNFSGELWWRNASVTRVSPGWTIMPIQPAGGGQDVGGGTVLLGAGRVFVINTTGREVGELKMGTDTGVSVGVGISGT